MASTCSLPDFTTLSSEALSQLLLGEGVPPGDVEGQEKETLVAMIQLGTATYNIQTWWAPEIFALAIMFTLGLIGRIGLTVLLSKSNVKAAQLHAHPPSSGHPAVPRTPAQKKEDSRQKALARTALLKPATQMLCHLINLIMSTIALILQLAAWRLFIITSTPFRLRDIQILSFAIKLLLGTYAGELLFGSSYIGDDILMHHLATFVLLLFGQIAAFRTQSPRFFRMAQFLLLQATTEQLTYLAMVFKHYSSFLGLQGKQQTSALKLATMFMGWTRFITWPQKVVPVVFALYWSGRMWSALDEPGSLGQAWLGTSTALIVALLLLQVYFCDQVFALAAGFRWSLDKMQGHAVGPPPSRQGPVIRRLLGLIGKGEKPSPSDSHGAARQGSRPSSRTAVARRPSVSNELSKGRRSSRYDEEKAELFDSDEDAELAESYRSSRKPKTYGRLGEGAPPGESDAQTSSDDDARPPSYRSRKGSGR